MEFADNADPNWYVYDVFQAQADPNQWNGGYYGYAPTPEGYGYAQVSQVSQDPNMYYGGYPAGYGNYQQSQQQQQQQQQVGYSWV